MSCHIVVFPDNMSGPEEIRMRPDVVCFLINLFFSQDWYFHDVGRTAVVMSSYPENPARSQISVSVDRLSAAQVPIC